MKRKIVKAIGWGIAGAIALSATAALAYTNGWKERGITTEVWPVYAVFGIWVAAGKGFIALFLASLFRSWLKSLPPNPHKKN